MKSEKIIVGLILTAVGLILLYWGYQKMQPSTIERGLDFLGEISRSMGEEMPVAYKKDNTGAIIMMIAGGVLSLFGLSYILKSRE
ncbi:MAG: DUF3185 family protein [Candidatus Moranbacteria bacterium]|nr:DUF3185 family protein [Candidatus Moranbacteria bacterium]